jgi:hypothetical protein
MKWLKKLFKGILSALGLKWFRKSSKGVLLTLGLLALRVLIAGAQVSVSPTAPPTASSALTTVLGYLQWLGIVGGVGLGALIAGIKIALQHDMEGGKRDLMYSIVGGIVITLIATILNLFI